MSGHGLVMLWLFRRNVTSPPESAYAATNFYIQDSALGEVAQLGPGHGILYSMATSNSTSGDITLL